MNLNRGDLVTTLFSDADQASNTCEVVHVTHEYAFLSHPLAPEVIIKRPLREINVMHATGKCSSERALDYVNAKRDQLDFASKKDLNALCIVFVVKRYLTSKQKNSLANLLGELASHEFAGNSTDAISYVVKNEAVLDDFNRLWYNNFKRLFDGTQPITSKKQRSAIFNMAGFILSELKNPKFELTNEG